MFEFSEKLNQRLRAYLHSKYGVVVSNDEANNYLNSLADLYALLR